MVSAWPWLELPGLRITMPAEAPAHTFRASGSKEFNAVAGDDSFWAAQGRVPGLGLSGPGCEAFFVTRRRVSRVAAWLQPRGRLVLIIRTDVNDLILFVPIWRSSFLQGQSSCSHSVCVNSTPHTSQFLVNSHLMTHMRGSSYQFGVRTSHSMRHPHSLMWLFRLSSTSPLSSLCCPSVGEAPRCCFG